jgi:hypothetical protein
MKSAIFAAMLNSGIRDTSSEGARHRVYNQIFINLFVDGFVAFRSSSLGAAS